MKHVGKYSHKRVKSKRNVFTWRVFCVIKSNSVSNLEILIYLVARACSSYESMGFAICLSSNYYYQCMPVSLLFPLYMFKFTNISSIDHMEPYWSQIGWNFYCERLAVFLTGNPQYQTSKCKDSSTLWSTLTCKTCEKIFYVSNTWQRFSTFKIFLKYFLRFCWL